MKKYKYNSATPFHGTFVVDGTPKDIAMYQGETYELPAECDKVAALVAQKILTPEGKKPAKDA